MNEQIKKLAEQCWINDGGPDSYFSQQKFAELIVRECAEIDFRHKVGLSFDDDFLISQAIKEYFGVE
jgi:hypothetical protein